MYVCRVCTIPTARRWAVPTTVVPAVRSKGRLAELHVPILYIYLYLTAANIFPNCCKDPPTLSRDMLDPGGRV